MRSADPAVWTLRRYCFFGREVVVESDTAAVAETLDAIYARQRIEPIGAPAAAARSMQDLNVRTAPDLHVRVSAGDPAGPRIQVGRRTIRVPDAPQLVHYAHLVLINLAAAGARDAVVLHGGVVARGGKAVLLVGGSGWGKSTLTLELVRRGWYFLSDDFAVLTPDGLVHPFPRRVNLTDASVALLGITPPEGELRLAGFGGREKWMIDIEALFPGHLSGPARLGSVFLLVPSGGRGGQPQGAAPAPAEVTWSIELDHLPDGLVATLAELPGVRAVNVASAAGPATIELTPERGHRIVGPLDAVCALHDVTILSASRGPAPRPDFAALPLAERAEVGPVLPELLAHALCLSGRRFLSGTTREAVQSSLGYLRQALDRSEVPVYRLVPGRLAESADLVERIAGWGEG